MELDYQWANDVKEIRSFLDEKYSVSLPTKISVNYDTDYQYGWAKIGVDKFCDRVIPQLRGNTDIAFVLPKLRLAIRDAVSFGNSTIIVDELGLCRVSTPENSYAYQDAFGTVFFTEDLGGVRFHSVDGQSFIEDDKGNWEPTTQRTFTVFYDVDGAHPYGRSRITISIRKTIRSASRAKLKAEIASNYRAYPMIVFSGLWEQLSEGVVSGISKLKTGASNVLGLPKDPFDGQKIDVTEISAADFTPFITLKEAYAKDVAAAFNIDPSELGVMTANPSSADALYATKEDLVIEISNFENSIQSVLQSVVNYVADVLEVEAPQLVFAEPATPSKASQADAFVKLASVIPQLKYSPAALQWAGLPNDLIQEIAAESADWEDELEAQDESA